MLTPEEFTLIYQQGELATYAFFLDIIQKVNALEERTQLLEVRNNKNSSNSSKPPSSDGYKKPTPNLRLKSGKKSGGQPGHKGHTLEMREKCDNTEVHSPQECSKCGHNLKETEPIKTDQAQVHDLPPLKFIVTAHLRHHKICPNCKHETVGKFPEGVRAGTQYGFNLKAMAVYLQYGQFIPSDRTAQFFREVFHVPISEGSLLNFLKEASKTLIPVEEDIKKKLIAQPVLHFDETGMRIGKKLNWFHVVSSRDLTFYAPHKKRGKEAIEAIDILPGYLGVAIHDCWASYLKYASKHGLCNVHFVRELKGLFETTPHLWIKRLLRFLFGLKRHKDVAKAAGRAGFSPHELAKYEAVYARILAEGQSQHPASAPSGKRGKTRQSSGHNLLKRLDIYRVSVLRFITDFEVPFENNQAERDVRMVKLRQKTSGCFRSEIGSEMFCRIRGYISTVRKQGHSLFSSIVSIFDPSQSMPIISG